MAFQLKQCTKMTALALAACAVLAGCGAEEPEQAGKVPVKTMQVLQQDTPVAYSYAGRVSSKDEVKIHPRCPA